LGTTTGVQFVTVFWHLRIFSTRNFCLWTQAWSQQRWHIKPSGEGMQMSWQTLVYFRLLMVTFSVTG
jgi:hypothetical protein